jgi:hypothetical protein
MKYVKVTDNIIDLEMGKWIRYRRLVSKTIAFSATRRRPPYWFCCRGNGEESSANDPTVTKGKNLNSELYRI